MVFAARAMAELDAACPALNPTSHTAHFLSRNFWLLREKNTADSLALLAWNHPDLPRKVLRGGYALARIGFLNLPNRLIRATGLHPPLFAHLTIVGSLIYPARERHHRQDVVLKLPLLRGEVSRD